jgi:hypothetical protein
MWKNFDYKLLFLFVLSAYAVGFDASLGDAIILAALSGLYALNQYFKHVQVVKKLENQPITEKALADIEELKTSMNSLKVGRAFGR